MTTPLYLLYTQNEIPVRTARGGSGFEAALNVSLGLGF